jgi:hypothetical protein
MTHARRRECIGPREASHDIVFEEPSIEAERRTELEQRGIGRVLEPA